MRYAQPLVGATTPEDIRARFRTAFQAQRALGRTTDSIATQLGLPASTVRNYANGSKTPPVELWPTIAEALNENVGYFLYGDDASDTVRRLELAETVAELSWQLAEVTELLRPLLDGKPVQADPRELQALARALGRQLPDDHSDPSS